LSVRENSSQKHRQVSGSQSETTVTPVDKDHLIDAGMEKLIGFVAGPREVLIVAIVAAIIFALVKVVRRR
jgi:phosphotransferase system  glucose/maltose/N-acetylglucosamine-specific IIC component